MEDVPGWKPFMSLAPGVSTTSLDAYVDNIYGWLRRQGFLETRDFRQVMVGGFPQFYVREAIYEKCVTDYVAQNRGSDYIERQVDVVKSNTTRRIADRPGPYGKRNLGKGKAHD